MSLISTSDSLPLTCVREGACCFGAVIRITPWELAVLARHLGQAPAAFRDRHTCDGGTALRLDGIHDRLGHRACSLYRAGSGCSAHPARPLACRLFPLGRQRADGTAQYHHPGRTVGCAELCPASQALPPMRVADYLATQEVAAGEMAHDAYAAMLGSMIATAAAIISGAEDPPAVAATLRERVDWVPEARVRAVPVAWFDLLTAPELAADPADPPAWIMAHRVRLAQAIASGWGLGADIGTAALTVGTLALHLGPTVGTAPALVAEAITAMVAPAAA